MRDRDLWDIMDYVEGKGEIENNIGFKLEILYGFPKNQYRPALCLSRSLNEKE